MLSAQPSFFTVSFQWSYEVLSISSGGFKLTFWWFTYCSSNKSVNPNNLIFDSTPRGWDFTELLFTCSELVAAVLLRSNRTVSSVSRALSNLSQFDSRLLTLTALAFFPYQPLKHTHTNTNEMTNTHRCFLSTQPKFNIHIFCSERTLFHTFIILNAVALWFSWFSPKRCVVDQLNTFVEDTGLLALGLGWSACSFWKKG